MTASTELHLPALVANVDRSAIVSNVVVQARKYAAAAHSKNTRRGYASDLRMFNAWCARNRFSSRPAKPQTVVFYVTELARTAKLATIRRHLAAITFSHREAGLESPASHEMVRLILRGVARTNGSKQSRKSAVTLDAIRAMLLEIRGDGSKALRDRAILLLGFAAALRRSEIAELTVDDVIFCKEGLRLRIRHSKTDQNAQGVELAVPFVANRSLCAVLAVREWIDAASIDAGPLFRAYTIRGTATDHSIDGRDVANLVKKLAARARIAGDFSGHSLRAGFVTVAAQAKVSLEAIARTTRHKSIAVLMGYIRPAHAFDDTALAAMIP